MVKPKNNKRHQGVTMESLDSKLDLVLGGHHSLDEKIDNFKSEVRNDFNEVNYKFDLVFEQLDIICADLK